MNTWTLRVLNGNSERPSLSEEGAGHPDGGGSFLCLACNASALRALANLEW